MGLIIHSSYGFLSNMPFGSYGETVILAAQNLIIQFLVYRFAKLSTSRVMLVGAVFCGLLGAVFSGVQLHGTRLGGNHPTNLIFTSHSCSVMVKMATPNPVHP